MYLCESLRSRRPSQRKIACRNVQELNLDLGTTTTTTSSRWERSEIRRRIVHSEIARGRARSEDGKGGWVGGHFIVICIRWINTDLLRCTAIVLCVIFIVSKCKGFLVTARPLTQRRSRKRKVSYTKNRHEHRVQPPP